MNNVFRNQKSIAMNSFTLKVVCFCMLLSTTAFSQTPKRSLSIKKTTGVIKIDGELTDSAWKNAPLANKFVESRPIPFKNESADNASEVYILYSNEGM